MRLLMIAEDPAMREGGIPRYAVPVAEALARRGHHVEYAFSGGYTGHYDWRFKRRWESDERDGVRYHCLVNPRNIGVTMGHPDVDVECDDTRWISGLADSVRPDVVHIHSLLGIPFEAIARLAERAPVVLSFHDFGLVCQRRVLVQPDGTESRTYPTQVECPTCVDVVDPRRYRLRARLRRTPGSIGMRLVHALERGTGYDAAVSRRQTATGPAPEATVARYRRRLAAGVAVVNRHVTRALAVSAAVREVLLGVGVEPALVDVVHIGSGSADRLSRLPLPSRESGTVTFMYLGSLGRNKGAHVLLEAAALLDPPPRLVVAGVAHEPAYREQLHALAPPSTEWRGPFGSAELPRLLAEADVVVALSVGPDTSPQVVLEALAAGRPVVGSRIGGIPDFVHDGVNGRLFEPGNAADLAAVLRELADPAVVARLAGEARREKSVEDHADELDRLYADVA